jgi:hypothetical protein
VSEYVSEIACAFNSKGKIIITTEITPISLILPTLKARIATMTTK